MQTRPAGLSIVSALAAVFAVACGGDSSSPAAPTTATYKATLVGSNERPTPNNSTATGTFTGTLDLKTNIMTYTVTFSGLVAPSTLSHIHGPGDANTAAGVVFDFKNGAVPFTAGPTAETYSGTLTLTAATSISTTVNGDSLRKLMDAGLAYVNVHSSTYGGGEIRGQITKQAQ